MNFLWHLMVLGALIAGVVALIVGVPTLRLRTSLFYDIRNSEIMDLDRQWWYSNKWCCWDPWFIALPFRQLVLPALLSLQRSLPLTSYAVNGRSTLSVHWRWNRSRICWDQYDQRSVLLFAHLNLRSQRLPDLKAGMALLFLKITLSIAH